MTESAKKVVPWLMENAPDCGDNSCLFGGQGKGGMRTNGGCRCFKDLPTARRVYVERLYTALLAQNGKDNAAQLTAQLQVTDGLLIAAHDEEVQSIRNEATIRAKRLFSAAAPQATALSREQVEALQDDICDVRVMVDAGTLNALCELALRSLSTAQENEALLKRAGLLEALRELIACKDLKERIEAGDVPELLAATAEYERRKVPAWEAARTALSAAENSK